MYYTQAQWIILFFLYSFFGWIWECCYVSAKKKKWVNRGFLYGPVLPIYGYGAIIILWLTLPVKDNLFLVYLFGMLGATLLEYVTGVLMEWLFQVRYWDYSNEPFNIKGHICLYCSLGWGLFSLVLVCFIHPNVEHIMLLIPEKLLQPLSLAGVIVMAVDTTKSVQAALSLKDLLLKLSKNGQRFQALELKAEKIQNSFAAQKEKFQDELEEETSEIQSQLSKLKEEMENIRKERNEKLAEYLENRNNRKALDILRRNPSAASVKFREKMKEISEYYRKNEKE